MVVKSSAAPRVEGLDVATAAQVLRLYGRPPRDGERVWGAPQHAERR